MRDLMELHLKRNSDLSIVWSVLFIAFFCHGILYFFSSPDAYYSYDSSIKIIKYAILLAALIMMLFERGNRIISKDLIPFSIVAIMILCAMIAQSSFHDYIILLNYCAPVFTLLLYPTLNKKLDLKAAFRFIYCFSSVVGYIEYLYLNERFTRFSYFGYRACSVFVNPNNFAAFLFLSTAILLMHEKLAVKRIALIVNSLILLRMTGSRSGLLIMLFAILLIYGYRVLRHFLSINTFALVRFSTALILLLLLFCAVLLIFFSDSLAARFSALFSSGRKLGDIDLKIGRYSQIINFFNRSDFNLVFPNRISNVYTDNMALHLWGFFGFPVMILYLICSAFFMLKLWSIDRKRCLLLILLFLFGFFTNYLYLWPIAYVYWFLVGTILYDGEAGASQRRKASGGRICFT